MGLSPVFYEALALVTFHRDWAAHHAIIETFVAPLGPSTAQNHTFGVAPTGVRPDEGRRLKPRPHRCLPPRKREVSDGRAHRWPVHRAAQKRCSRKSKSSILHIPSPERTARKTCATTLQTSDHNIRGMCIKIRLAAVHHVQGGRYFCSPPSRGRKLEPL